MWIKGNMDERREKRKSLVFSLSYVVPYDMISFLVQNRNGIRRMQTGIHFFFLSLSRLSSIICAFPDSNTHCDSANSSFPFLTLPKVPIYSVPIVIESKALVRHFPAKNRSVPARSRRASTLPPPSPRPLHARFLPPGREVVPRELIYIAT